MEPVKFVLEQWGRITAYFGDLLHLITIPKQFLASRSLNEKPDVAGSLAFLTLSYVVQAVVGSLFLPSAQRSLAFLSCLTVLCIVGTVPFAIGIHWAWRVVRGKASFVNSFVITGYLASVATLIILVGAVISNSMFLVLDHTAYQETMAGLKTGRLFTHYTAFDLGVLVITNSVWLIFCLIALIWFMAAWGAYRQVYGGGRFRSGCAFGIALLFEIPILVGIIIVALGVAMLVFHIE